MGWFLTQLPLKLAENGDVGETDLRVINAWKGHFLCYRKRHHDAQITWPYAYYVILGSRCKMANSSSEDETDTLLKRPTRMQPYQFEPIRQDFERVPEHRVTFEANPSLIHFHLNVGR